MGAGVVSALLSNAKIQGQLNQLYLVSGSIKPTAPTGIGTAQYLGALYRPFLALYSYAEAFEDETSGALKKMVPDDVCIVGCSNQPSDGELRKHRADRARWRSPHIRGREVRSEAALDTKRRQGRAAHRIAGQLWCRST